LPDDTGNAESVPASQSRSRWQDDCFDVFSVVAVAL